MEILLQSIIAWPLGAYLFEELKFVSPKLSVRGLPVPNQKRNHVMGSRNAKTKTMSPASFAPISPSESDPFFVTEGIVEVHREGKNHLFPP